MRVLYIARYRNALMERKIALLAAYPDIELTFVRPGRWHDAYGQVELPVIPNQPYRTLAVPLIGSPTDHHRVLYRTLRFGMTAFSPDLIHAEEEPDSLAALQIALARRLFAPRARLILHTWQNLNRPKAWYVWQVTRTTLHQADAILGSTAEAVDVLREMGYTGPAEIILQEGVNLEVFQPQKKSPTSEKFTITYAGRLAEEKGLDTVLHALFHLDTRAHLMLIGDGPARAGLEALIHSLGLDERVTFTGPVPVARMVELLNQSHALVLPSRTRSWWKEQFGRVLVEAMACKVPVVGSDSGAIPGVIGGAGLVFPEGNVDALAECLQRLIASPELCNTLAEQGYRRVQQYYSQERITEQTVQFYWQIVSSVLTVYNTQAPTRKPLNKRRVGKQRIMSHYILDARTAAPHFPGIGRYVTNLARALMPELLPDDRLTVLYDAKYPQFWPDSPQFQAVPLDVSPFGLAQQWVVPRLLKQLDADSDGPIRYHSAYYLMPYRPGVPTVLTVYDVIPLRFPAQSTPQARLLFRWATRLALHAARQVVAISEATRQDFIRHFHISPGRITAIPLAADPAFCPQPPEAISALRARYGLPEQFVLYLGSNKPHKNLVRLIEAWKLAARNFQPPTCPLIIAGAWDARYPESRRRVEALGLENSVRFLGPMAEADLPALYSAATAFAFPSLYEGFGLPVLEAMACGAPAACSNVSSLPEVAGDAALTFDPQDTDAIARALAQLCADADLRAELRARGLVRATQFSWQRTAQETLKIYRKVMT